MNPSVFQSSSPLTPRGFWIRNRESSVWDWVSVICSLTVLLARFDLKRFIGYFPLLVIMVSEVYEAEVFWQREHKALQ
ncbi:hypothetical protein K2173_021132 [Erythroxylum novogranatense]|uniref:Uncharacterized protein n=1 Tax=Erythroxylum novogranatense TaxID=1862640 RepID=A0AAV8TMP1_9ROSI|nr:hypothetical protein K2173_021132 [Erythroxylum novogranatense]